MLRQNTEWMKGYYGIIQGKVEKNESFLAAAVREAKEEAGVDIKSADLKHILTAHRNEPDSTWVDLCFEATNWHGEPHNAEPESHAELAWHDPKNLPENVIPAIKFYLENIEAGNSYCEYGWKK